VQPSHLAPFFVSHLSAASRHKREGSISEAAKRLGRNRQIKGAAGAGYKAAPQKERLWVRTKRKAQSHQSPKTKADLRSEI
jgi:hypothetical protein